MTMQPILECFSFVWRCAGWTLALFFFTAGGVWAQTYTYTGVPFAYDTPSGSASTVVWHTPGTQGGTWMPAPGCTSWPYGDDDWSDVAFPVGFSFRFAGTVYTSVRVYSNGMLKFGTDNSEWWTKTTSPAAAGLPVTTNSSITACTGISSQPLTNTIIGYWIDLVAGIGDTKTTASGYSPGAKLQYELLGTAPNRRLVFSWVNVKDYNSANRFNFQIALYETPVGGQNSNFKYQYTTGSSTGVGATVGVQVTSGDYTLFADNQAFIDTTVGTAILWYPAGQAVPKYAEYKFDEGSWTSDAGAVKDTSGNAMDATLVGTAPNLPINVAGGKLCRGASIPANTSNAITAAIGTPVVPTNTGSVNFWYQSNAAWNSTTAVLMDATTVATKPFYLSLAAGKLKFVVTDSANTVFTTTASSTPSPAIAANKWTHVGVTWNMQPGSNQTLFKLYVNGALTTSATTASITISPAPIAPRTTSSGGMVAGLSTLYIGDHRTPGVIPSGLTATTSNANGLMDEVYIYAGEVSASQVATNFNATRSGCTVLDHFHIVHGGSVTNCSAPTNVTIEAHDSAHNLYTLGGTTLNLSTSTSHGTWSNVTVAGNPGAVNVVADSGLAYGVASYVFSNEASITLGLGNTVTESPNINLLSGSITEHTGTSATCVSQDYTFGTSCDADLSFSCAVNPAGFNCVEALANASPASDAAASTGRLYTKLAGTAFAFDVVALKADGVTVETGFGSEADKPVTVELVVGSGATACADRAVLSPAVSQTLTFLKTSQTTELGRKSATMTVNNAYPNLLCRVTDANQTPNVQACSSDNFAIRPPAVTLTTTASAVGPSVSAAPAVRAGTAFALYATSTAAPNYTGGLARVGTVALSAVGGATPAAAIGTLTLTPATIATNPSPVPSGNATYTEVGYLNLPLGAYSDTTYTAVDSAVSDCITGSASDTLPASPAAQKYGCNITHNAASLGRFQPAYFTTVVTPGCSGFTYAGSTAFPPRAGQPFTVVTTAKAIGGSTTANYAGVYAKTVTLSDAGGATGTLTGTTSFTNGVGTASNVIYTTATPKTAPLTLTIRATDNDTTPVDSKLTSTTPVAGFSTTPEGTAPIRSGRARIQNAYGSERLDLPMPLTTEYWTGTGWAINTLDTCSGNAVSGGTLSLASPVFVAAPPGSALTAANVATNIYVWDSGNPGLSGIGFATAAAAMVPSKAALQFKKPPATGNFNLNLRAPGATMTGSVDIIATVPTWLQFNWLGGAAVSPTQGRATFGIFKSPLIYRRENY